MLLFATIGETMTAMLGLGRKWQKLNKKRNSLPIPYITVRCNHKTDLILFFVFNNGITSACDCIIIIIIKSIKIN